MAARAGRPAGRASADELLLRLRCDPDAALREELVRRHLPLARALARRFERGSDSLEDLAQVAALGLVKAVDRFDPSRGVQFTTFAVPTIVGELKRHRRDTGWAVRVSRSIQERTVRLNSATGELTRQLGRSPTPSELGEAIGASVEEVLEAIEAGRARDTASIDAPLALDGEDGGIGEAIGREDARFEVAELNATIEPALRELPAVERLVLHLRFVEDLAQREIAELLGTSQVQVSRLLRRALEQLRTATADDLGPAAPAAVSQAA